MTPGNIQQTITEVKEILLRLESRLDVHDQKHVQLEKEHCEFDSTIKEHTRRLSTVENLAVKNERETEKLTGALTRFAWIVVTPVISMVVIALIILAAQVAK